MAKILSRRVLFGCTMVANVIYILWRIFCTIPEDQGYVSLFFALGLLIVEILGMFEMFVHFTGMSKIEVPERPEIDLDLYPEVDVFIATYNEPIELVQKTINGAIRMQYPDKNKVHIHVCDDGTRPEMEAVAKKMGVGYIIREEHKGAKAGNLNNAMKFTNAPIIVTLDADMIPMHDFLLATVPYFLKNEQAEREGSKDRYEKIGFIQTPQSFYNTDLFQFNLHSEGRIPNEQDYFYRDIQVAKNASNTPIYGGSNTVIAREAIEEVGGFFTNSITEDFATGMLIQSKKFRCYAIPEVHASGLSPDDLRSLVKQRERWARGCIQTGRRVNLLFMRGLTIKQKISYVSSITYWYASIKRFFYIMAPIVFAVFGILVVDCTLPEVLLFWLPTYLLTSTSLKKLSNNIRNTRWTNIYETILFQALMPSVILETLCISKNKFAVTRKSKEEMKDGTYRFIQAIPFFLYSILSVIGIVNMVRYTFWNESAYFIVVLFWLVANMFTLVMALFFLSGRKQLRKTERYVAVVDCVIKQGTLDMSCKTVDVSEAGFAIELETPEYIDPEKEFEATFTMEAGAEVYKTNCKAKIAQVLETKTGWKYSCYITEIDEENTDEWNLIVHDRIPTLPQEIDSRVGVFEDLQINIKKRTIKTPLYSRKLARVQKKGLYQIEGVGGVIIQNFNYEYVVLQISAGKYPQDITIPITETLELVCEKNTTEIVGKGQLYSIVNTDTLMERLDNREAFISWLTGDQLMDIEPEQKKVKEKDVDLMDHV